jgi:hypothetical protein
MSLLWGLFGALLGACWLGWMLRTKRTPNRGVWRRSVTSAERPSEYWAEVAFVGIFLLICLAVAANAASHVWIG